MNVAILLYGQPRDYRKGYSTIMEFIKRNSSCKFDFFYHIWKINENETYKHSPLRNLDKSTLTYNNSMIEELNEMYHPLSYEIENQSTISFNNSFYKNTIAFHNTRGLSLTNIDNILYNLYSKNKSRNLLNEHLKNNPSKYDSVICVRFDINTIPEVILDEKNKDYVHLSNCHLPRKIFADNFVISPTDIFLKWFNFFEYFKFILDNKILESTINQLNEKLLINAEELLFASYIFHYKNTDKILYFQGGRI